MVKRGTAGVKLNHVHHTSTWYMYNTKIIVHNYAEIQLVVVFLSISSLSEWLLRTVLQED